MKFAFTKNPYIVSAAGRSPYEVANSRGKQLYSGMFSGRGDYDISEVLDALAADIPNNHSALVAKVLGADKALGVLSATYDESVIPIRGGVDLATLRSSPGDVFERFMPRAGNFVLTTRTASNVITMKRGDAFSLFFCVGTSGAVKLEMLTDATSGVVTLCRSLEPWGVYALTVLQGLPAEVQSVSFRANGVHAFSIQFEEREAAEAHHLVRYRNALGVFEQLELSGRGSVDFEAPSKEADYSLRVDHNHEQKHRKRIKPGFAYTLPSGFVSPERVPAFMDMLHSEEVYLVCRDGHEVPVIPTTKAWALGADFNRPLNFDITFVPALSDNMVVLPELNQD